MTQAAAPFDLRRRLVAEAVGTAWLLAMVIGSGIMAERLAGGNEALALLANTLATGTGLAVLIVMLGPVSGGQFNPAVTLAFWLRGALPAPVAAAYVGAQVAGALAGAAMAHAMFALPVLQVSLRARDGAALAFSEVVATFGLITAILTTLRFQPGAVPAVVGLYIASAYWFTASTSFANPAVTLARALTDSFSGIAPASVAAFVVAQLCGALLATGFCRWLLMEDPPCRPSR